MYSFSSKCNNRALGITVISSSFSDITVKAKMIIKPDNKIKSQIYFHNRLVGEDMLINVRRK